MYAKRQELTNKAYDSLTEAVEELEKDLELNPRKFLGVALYPGQIWSAATFVGAIVFGIIQQKLQPDD